MGKHRTWWKHTAAGALALAGIAASTPSRADETQKYNLTFTTQNQSMWSPGQGANIDWSQELGFDWDFDLGTIGGFWNPSVDLVFDTISLGDTGASIGAKSKRRAGLFLDFLLQTGTVNVDYPVRVKVEYPQDGTLYPGDPFTIKTSWERSGAAKIATTGPRARFEMGAYFKAKSKIPFRAAVAGEDLFNGDLLASGPLGDIDIREDLFTPIDTASYEGEMLLPGQPGTTPLQLNWDKLILNSEGTLSAEASGSQLTSSVRDNFLRLNGSVTNFWFPSSIEFNRSFGVGYLDLRVELMNLYCDNFDFDGRQNFSLTPEPTIDIPVPGGQTVRVKVGQSVNGVYPSVAPGTKTNDQRVDSTVTFANRFNSRTELVVAPRLFLKPFYLYAKGGLDIPYIGGFDFGPWELDPFEPINVAYEVGSRLGLLDNPDSDLALKLYENNYELGGFNTGSVPFEIKGYTYPAPMLSEVAPLMIQQGSPAKEFIFTGSDFVPTHGINPSTKVHWDGPAGPADRTSERETTYLSPLQVTGVLTRDDLAVEAVHYVTVFNPAPGGGASNRMPVMVDGTPPAYTAAANPPRITLPSGKMVPVTISGRITDNMVGVDPTTPRFAVVDEYGQVQPAGEITLRADGNYAFTILLEARRNGTDLDGRDYTVTIRAADKVRNASSTSFKINVNHDQSKK